MRSANLVAFALSFSAGTLAAPTLETALPVVDLGHVRHHTCLPFSNSYTQLT